MKRLPRTQPEDLLREVWPYVEISPEQRDRTIQIVCRTAMDQWMALPEEDRIRWPPEPGPAGEEILRGWAKELRESDA